MSFVCMSRQFAPFVTERGKLKLRECHDFGPSIVTDKNQKMDKVSLEESLRQEALRLSHEPPPEAPKISRPWTVEVKSKVQVPNMVELLSHPTPTTAMPRQLDRRTWDGGAASSRAPEVEEIGKPMVTDATPSKTRLAVLSNKALSGKPANPRPSWVCWERHQTHT
mmetsp:Transcript_24731/g.57339  ORF Transcript_24731/g.57339 Transcript_24731/m.57339 type:complete len:166 (-) Transcript_24731:88-585(-)